MPDVADREGRDVLEAPVTGGGGPIEVRFAAVVPWVPTLGLGLGVGVAPVAPAGRLAVVGGVLVLDVDVLDMPFMLLPSCLVGLLTGLLKPLKVALAPGVGLALPTTALLLFPGTPSCFFNPLTPAYILEGRDLGAPAVPVVLVGFGFGCGGSGGCSGCSSTCLTPAERKNMPYPG